MSGRIRSIKPEWLEDELLARSSSEARVLSVALILMADDYGRGRAAFSTLLSRVFPQSVDSPEALQKFSRDLREALGRLSDIRFVTLYEVDGQSYYAIRNWEKHQRVHHPGRPLVPAPIQRVLRHSGESPELSGESRESLPRNSESLPPDQDQDQDQDQDLEREREGEPSPAAPAAVSVSEPAFDPTPVPASETTPAGQPGGKKRGSRAKPVRRPLSEWQPGDAHRELASKLGLDLFDQLEQMRDYAAENPGWHKEREGGNWDATFRNWLKRSFRQLPSWEKEKIQAKAQLQSARVSEDERKRAYEAFRAQKDRENEALDALPAPKPRQSGESPSLGDLLKGLL